MKFIYLAGVIGTAVILWFAFASAGPQIPVSIDESSSKKTAGQTVIPSSVSASGDGPRSAAVTPAPQEADSSALPANASSQAIQEFIQETAVSYDARELPKIRPFLTHPDSEVRAAALQGMITLGDAAGAPLLRTAAREVTNPDESAAMLKAADYLELPSATLAPTLKRRRAAQSGNKP